MSEMRANWVCSGTAPALRGGAWLCVVGLATALSACGDDSGGDDDDDGRGPANDAAPPRDDAAPRDADTAGDTGAGGSGSTGPSIWTHLGYDARSNYFNPNETAIT